jgi:hypothetical protein
LHSVNTSTEVIKTRATLNVEALESPVYTKTDTYTAYSQSFSIPPTTSGFVESRSCTVPPDVRFWRLSTLAHKQAVATTVLDGTQPILESFDWAHPMAETLLAPPFLTFASTKLGYACSYDNPHNRTIHQGDSYQTDEECLAVGYFFPATRPLKCYNGIGPF